MSGPSPREVAAECLRRVLYDGGFSQHVLAGELGRAELGERERAFVTAAVYGTLTELRRLDLGLERALPRGLDSLPELARCHLRLSAWQLDSHPDAPPAPVVSAGVNAIREAGFGHLSGVANAVLRKLAADRAVVFEPPTKAPPAARFGVRWGVSDWIAESLISQVGEDEASRVMQAFNAPTPVHARVRRGEREALLAELLGAGLRVAAHPLVPTAIVCERGNLAATAAHAEGRIAIQDAGAQLAALCLPSDLGLPAGAVGGARLLDACAGLGGKALALRDRWPTARVVATDSHAGKLDSLRAAPGGAGVVSAAWTIGEVAPAEVRDNGPYSAVLLDAPCSALGTLGRHPEVRWNRGPGLVEELGVLQRKMLHEVAPLVAPGGYLLYVVCTWTAAETWAPVEALLSEGGDFGVSAPGAESAASEVEWGRVVDARGAVTLWPQVSATDGFTMIRLKRSD